MPGGLPGEYVVARVGDLDVAGIGTLPDSGGPPGAVWATYVRVDSADAAVERATGAGATLVLGPLDASRDGRLAVLADPAGAAFGVWEPRGRQGAQLVGEPRAWAMSSLHTPDPEGAGAFYGALFGWEAAPIAPGSAVTAFRLPGYAGGEPGGPAPPGVVAVMTGTGGDPAVPPHWDVNLRVDDADATAARAAQLGGTVLAGPMDTPGFRSAVLLDPQGAAFSVSHLAPAG